MVERRAIRTPGDSVRDCHSPQGLEDSSGADNEERAESFRLRIVLIDRHDAGVKRSVRTAFPVIKAQPGIEVQAQIRFECFRFKIEDHQRIADAGEDVPRVDRNDEADEIRRRDAANGLGRIRPPFANRFPFDIDENERVPFGDPDRTFR